MSQFSDSSVQARCNCVPVTIEWQNTDYLSHTGQFDAWATVVEQSFRNIIDSMISKSS
jgi:hypothetical protein